MEKEVEKKPIGPTLKRMQVGDKETFPVWRALSVRSTIGQIQTVTDMRFSTRFYCDAETVRLWQRNSII